MHSANPIRQPNCLRRAPACKIGLMNIARAFGSELWKEWINDGAPRHAAAIAYYTVFSLPALLLIVLSIASMMLGESTVSTELFGTMRMYIGDRTTDLLERTLQNIRDNRMDGSWTAYVGAILLIAAASGIMRELQVALNKIIGTQLATKSVARHVISYLWYLIVLLTTALVLIAAIISGTIIGLLGQRVEAFLSIPVEVLGLINNGVTYAAVTLMIFILYTFLPAKRFSPVIVFLCSIIVSSLLVIGTVAASYYISRTGLGKAYGVAANVLILLFWIYFGANVFLFGAEMMEVADRLQNAPSKPQSRLARLLRRK